MPVVVDRAPCPAERAEGRCGLDLGHVGPHQVGEASGVLRWEEVVPEGERCPSSREVVLPPSSVRHVQRCRGRRGHGGWHWATEPNDRFTYTWEVPDPRVFAGGEPRDLVPGDFAEGVLLPYAGDSAPQRRRCYRLGFWVGSGIWRLRGVTTSDDFETYVEATYPAEGDQDACLDGFYDALEGREDGHSKFCRHHFDGPGGCGVA